MEDLINILLVIHIVSAMAMAWPYYALAAVNQRVALGPPLGDRTDRYMENILKNRTTACFVFQATVLASGLLLIWARVADGQATAGDYFGDWAIDAKIVILVLMAVMLMWVYLKIQPAVDALFGEYSELDDEAKKRIGALRLRRKKMATGCMFFSFAAAILGVESIGGFPAWLTVALLAATALWVWRSYSSRTAFGWI